MAFPWHFPMFRPICRVVFHGQGPRQRPGCGLGQGPPAADAAGPGLVRVEVRRQGLRGGSKSHGDFGEKKQVGWMMDD